MFTIFLNVQLIEAVRRFATAVWKQVGALLLFSDIKSSPLNFFFL